MPIFGVDNVLYLMACGGGGGSGSPRDIPGYFYDKEKRRYFRTPPQRLAYMMDSYNETKQRNRVNSREGTPSRVSGLVVGRLDCPRSMFALTSNLRTSPDTVKLRRTAVQTALCGSRPRQETAKDSKRSDYLIDIVVSRDGILALFGGVLESSLQIARVAKLAFQRKSRKVKLSEMCPIVRVDNLSGSEYLGIAEYDRSCTIVVFSTGNILMAFDMYGDYNEHYEGYVIPNPCDNVLGVVPRFMGNVLCSIASYIDDSTIRNSMGIEILKIRDYVELCRDTAFRIRNEKKVTALTLTDTEHLFIGTRSGKVLSRDLRSHSTSLAFSIPREGNLNPSIIKLHSTDDDYLITNCMDSKMLLWDLRHTKRPVLSYAGYTNSHHWCHSCVDESNQLIVAVNEDKSISSWSTWTGNLLRQISPSEYVSDESCLDGVDPGIAHTNRLGGVEGVKALLVCTPEGLTSFNI